MRIGQLSIVLGTLRDVFVENHRGLVVDPMMARFFADGLREMEQGALELEQMVLQLEDQLAELGQAPLYRPVAAVQDNVVPFPVIPRPRPMPIEGGCA